MNSLVQDVLNASMVFMDVELMNKPDARSKLAEAANGEVIGVDLGLSLTLGGAPEPSRRFVLQRERISLEVTPGRSSVAMEYSPRDFTQIAEIVTSAIENTEFEGQQLSAYGYNMMLVIDPNLGTSAVEHLGKYLFASTKFGREGWERAGGLGILYFSDGDRRWTFNVEPRPRDDVESNKLFMSMNLHLTRTVMPAEGAIVDTFTEMLDEAVRFTEQLTVGR